MNKKIKIQGRAARLAWVALICLPVSTAAQTPVAAELPTPLAAVSRTPEQIENFKEAPAPPAEESADSMFPHFRDRRFWVSGQMNFIFQAHPEFHARYTGTNSLLPNYEKATSRVLTVYTGLRINGTTELLGDAEETGGSALSQSLGIAGFSNLDAVRNTSLSKAPYLARAIFHKVIPLGGKRIENERGPTSTFNELPERRIDIRAGKFCTVDFFDVNSVGSDSHFQFMNWSTAQNGAYDYAADTRGYTWGALIEYQAKNYAFRAGDMLMPKIANGIDMEWNLRKAHAENFEFELRKGLLPKKEGTIRFLSYINHANMGVYRDAVARFEGGITPVPEISVHPFKTTIKYGFGMNIEQMLSKNFKAYARWGWNNGKTESFAYTEIDSTFAVGLGADGHQWHRNKDRAGVAFVSNAISKDHQNYLADGGLGFIIGDGALRYGRENILEAYYTLHLWRGMFIAPDLQHVQSPAYNRDRGPVLIPGFRGHVEF
jgi:high affinity Mn2+ porin